LEQVSLWLGLLKRAGAERGVYLEVQPALKLFITTVTPVTPLDLDISELEPAVSILLILIV